MLHLFRRSCMAPYTVPVLLLLAGCQHASSHSATADNVTHAATASASEAPTSTGQALATTRCAQCHAVTGSGDSPLSQAPAFRTLAQRYPLDTLGEALAEGIVAGHAAMPSTPWTPEEIEALLAYLKALP